MPINGERKFGGCLDTGILLPGLPQRMPAFRSGSIHRIHSLAASSADMFD
jgi:hypothetical protein